ncbi:MAG TPA: hypothetical protein VFC21_10210 [Bryobacteraceae bacterium]|nr:hypothetical protein [Bryobacteraceae bacterium]
MTPPGGTFLAKVSGGAVQLPPPVKRYCEASEWSLFRVRSTDDHRLELQPVRGEGGCDFSDDSSAYLSALAPDGRLWIPAPLRTTVGMGEQSVMMRVENGVIAIYLRKVFETLGFGP